MVDPDDPPPVDLVRAICDALDQAWARFEDTGGLSDHGLEVAAEAAWRWFAAHSGNSEPPLIGTWADPEFRAHQDHKHAVEGCGYCPSSDEEAT